MYEGEKNEEEKINLLIEFFCLSYEESFEILRKYQGNIQSAYEYCLENPKIALVDNLENPNNENEKKKFACKFFMKGENCKYGDNCKYRHPKPIPCRDQENCKRKDCWFAHEKRIEPKKEFIDYNTQNIKSFYKDFSGKNKLNEIFGEQLSRISGILSDKENFHFVKTFESMREKIKLSESNIFHSIRKFLESIIRDLAEISQTDFNPQNKIETIKKIKKSPFFKGIEMNCAINQIFASIIYLAYPSNIDSHYQFERFTPNVMDDICGVSHVIQLIYSFFIILEIIGKK